MSSSQPSILLYAEFLSNIRQVSVGCDLPTPISITTRAIVCADGRALTVAHHGSSATIQLPVKVAPLLPLPITKSVRTSLAWKIPLRVPSNGHNIPPSSEESVPWSGIDLEPGSAVTCRTCKSVILNTGTLKVWKDLPSENWAEMMEFWHCHKPDSHKDGNDEEDLANRGYGASSRIAAQPGVGFVDLTSFLLAESDLAKASISASEVTNSNGNETKVTKTALHCAICKTQLGIRNDQALSVSIFKWQVLVKQRIGNIPESGPSLAQCVSAMLLAMARSGCSKSVLLPIKGLSRDESRSGHASPARDVLNIWIYNANITFSSTEAPTSPINAVKVFYRMVSQEEADKMLDSLTSGVEDISLPLEAITTIVELLKKSNAFIPEGDREFKEWTVGFLEKWGGKGG
ncbi:ubiquitin-conjugating enzyme E2-binding protein [Nemania diffusa]|nr:ubiquitin-conjugating enzyme E2-binding protein [Nemania diffusa]